MLWKKTILGLAIITTLSGLPGCGPKVQVHWEKYSPEMMAEAKAAGKPVVMYFYAAWCPPCYTLKEKTFSQTEVIRTLDPFSRLKVDMSFRHSDKVRALAVQFQIRSYPSILFFDPAGNEIKELRIEGFVPPNTLETVATTILDEFSIPIPAAMASVPAS